MELCCFSIPLSECRQKISTKKRRYPGWPAKWPRRTAFSAWVPWYAWKACLPLNDEVMAFNSQCGNGILHGWRQRKSCGETKSSHAQLFWCSHLSDSLSSGGSGWKSDFTCGMETLRNTSLVRMDGFLDDLSFMLLSAMLMTGHLLNKVVSPLSGCLSGALRGYASCWR